MSTFHRKHHLEVAKMLATLDYPDYVVQELTNKFGVFFEKDNKYFNFVTWQSYVTRLREGRE